MIEEQMKRDFNPTRIMSLQIPECIDFGFCCINKKTIKQFKLFNYKNIPLEFSFSDTFYEISPKNGTILPNHQEIITISCLYQEAKIIVAKSIINVTGEEPQIIKISAIGKFPFLNISQQKLFFQNILIGEKISKEIEIINVSEVETDFFIEEEKQDKFDDFSLKIHSFQGNLPSQRSYILKITYTPKIPNFVSYKRLKISCLGGNYEYVEIFGSCKKMELNIPKNFINFQQIRLNYQCKKSLMIYNDFEKEMVFEIFNLCGIFSSNLKRGIINPKGYVKINFNFFPKETINYFQKIFVLIENFDLQSIELFGSSRHLFLRPDPLSNYLTENQLKESCQKNKFKILHKTLNKRKEKTLASTFYCFEKENNESNIQEENNFSKISKKLSEINNHTELIQNDSLQNFQKNSNFELLFEEKQLKNSLFQFSSDIVNFQNQQINQDNITKQISIQNNTQDITLHFNFFINDPCFKIDKKKITLEPKQIKNLLIQFQPLKESNFYFSKLQIVITSQEPQNSEENSQTFIDQENKLILTDYRLILLGNTFSVKKPPFIPMVDLYPTKQILFPPCNIGQKVYQTLKLNNKTDTPCLFEILNLKKPFKIYPTVGFIPSNTFTHLIIEFLPQKYDIIQQDLYIKFNLNHRKKISLKGYCNESKLNLQNQGKLYFVPCYLGVKTEIEYMIRNTGRMSVKVKINIPECYNEELSFNITEFNLPANESKIIKCQFVPYKIMKYRIKCPIFTNGEKDSRYQIKVFGEGKDGDIEINPPEMNFGIIMVNFVKSGKFILKNTSETTFNVKIRMIIEGDYSEDEKNNMLQYFLSDFQGGVIPAKSHKEMLISFNPKDICDFKLKILADVQTNIQDSDEKYICTKAFAYLIVKSNYPLLKIINVKNNTLSLASLWEKFEIQNINSELSQNLTPYEKKNLFSTKPLFKVQEEQNLIKNFLWNFGYIHGNNKQDREREILIVFQNIGGTDLEWRFEIDDETQYNVKENNDDQNEQEFDQNLFEKKYFSFKPKKGKLIPYQTQKIIVTYHPFQEEESFNNHNKEKSNEEEHLLNAFLRIQNGKSIKITLQGKTLSSFQGKLVLKSNHVRLPNLPINLLCPVEVPIGLLNIGSNNLKYRINKKKFYHMNNIKPQEMIIDFQNEDSTLQTGEKKYLIILFKPNQVKKYIFNVELKVYDFFKEIQNLEFVLEGQGCVDQQSILQNPFFIFNDDVSKENTLLNQEEDFAYISEELLDFRNSKYGIEQKRILFLKNTSKKLGFSFSFTNFNFLKKNEFNISPSKGQLRAGENIMITFSLTQKGIPNFLEGEINCKIKWDSDLERKSIISAIADKLKDSLCREETLFIRIKKSPNILDFIENFQNKLFLQQENKQMLNIPNNNDFLDQFFNLVVNPSINENCLQQQTKQFQNEELYCFMDYDDIDLFEEKQNEEIQEENIEQTQIFQIFQQFEEDEEKFNDLQKIQDFEKGQKLFRNFMITQ